MKKPHTMQCIIDTISISVEFTNIENLIIPQHLELVVKESDRISKGTKTLIINLHKFSCDKEYKRINSLKEFKKLLEEVLQELRIVNREDIELKRMDIAIDTSLDFNQNFKFFLMLFDLYTFNNAKIDRWYTTNLDTLKKNTIIWKNSHYEVVFYDKKEESHGSHDYNTRMEFRFKRLSKMDFEKHIDKLTDNLKDLEENIPELEESMANRLIKLWKEEFEQGEVTTFREFVRKYNIYFYTTNIIKLVYKQTGLKGACSKWIERFRESNKLEFYSKATIVKMKKDMLKSIKTYKKN